MYSRLALFKMNDTKHLTSNKTKPIGSIDRLSLNNTIDWLRMMPGKTVVAEDVSLRDMQIGMCKRTEHLEV